MVHEPEREPRTVHFAIAVIVPPPSDDGSKFSSFYSGSIIRAIDDVFDLCSKSLDVLLRRSTSKLSVILDLEVPA